MTMTEGLANNCTVYIVSLYANGKVKSWIEKNIEKLKESSCKVIEMNEKDFFSGKKELKGGEGTYLFFLGHGTPQFLMGENRNYTTKDIARVLNTLDRKLDFIGFDVCLFGSLKNLSAFIPYARLVAGTSFNDPEWGWEVVYVSFPSLIKGNGNFESLFLHVVNSFYDEMLRKIGEAMKVNSLPCVELNLITDKGITTVLRKCVM